MKHTILFIFLLSAQLGFAQSEGISEIKMQFITHVFSSQENFQSLHAAKASENEKYIFYETNEALGSRYISIIQSKADTAQWLYYVEYPMVTAQDLADIAQLEPHVFGVLNVHIQSGRLKGDERTEGDIVRTDLYIAKSNEWFGELVTDNAKKKFHILLTNARW